MDRAPEMIDLFTHELVANGTYSGNYPTETPTSLTSFGVGTPVALSGGPAGAGGTPTTTATTPVIATHGKEETQTIIERDNLPPGVNEINAAAVAFPLDCFQMPGTIQMNPNSGLQVQSDQLSSPGAFSTEDLTGLSPMMITAMHTAIIINSARSPFQPQILLPHHQHHPPPLPSAIVVVTGIVPPSGTPPPSALQQAKRTPSTAVSKTKATPSSSVTTERNLKGQVESQQTTQHQPRQQQPQGTTSAVSVATSTQGTQATQAPCTAGLPTTQKKHTSKTTSPFNSQQPGTVPHPASANSSSSSSQGETAANPRQSNKQKQTTQHSYVRHHVKSGQSGSVSHCYPNDYRTRFFFSAATKALYGDSTTTSESNGEMSLPMAAAFGHYEVVKSLLARKAHIECRGENGNPPLIMASSGGHVKVVELILNHGANIEAQTKKTNDTAVSLACAEGYYEVVELLLRRGANKEHRNRFGFTPMSLAASGDYVNIIKLLLENGADINSKDGSKMGFSPLMSAAMNGKTATVKLLLDMGSDINAQIETYKNSALTLACFSGKQEIVSLLLERNANTELRARAGLTPLMEAANGGYTDVGIVLLDKGADVNASPVPATRDTALTIASYKGHYRFVELLLARGALVDVRNINGCTPLWLACHGGYLEIAQILFRHGADLQVQNNGSLSCLMTAFRKGHVKLFRWIVENVENVQQFPSDREMSRYFVSLTAKPDLLKKCQQCAVYIKQAKDKQALEANKNAYILLEELDMEKSLEESKRLAADRRREKKKTKKMEKRQQYSGAKDGEVDDEVEGNQDDEENDDDGGSHDVLGYGIDANSQGSNSLESDNRGVGIHPTVHHNNNTTSNKSKGNKENLQQRIPERKHQVPKNIAAIEPIVDLTPPPTKTATNKNRKKKNKKKQNAAEQISQQPAQYRSPPPVAVVEEKSHINANTKHHQRTVYDKDSKNDTSHKTKSEKEILREKIKEVEVVELSAEKVSKNEKTSSIQITDDGQKGSIRDKEIESHVGVQQVNQLAANEGLSLAEHGNGNKKSLKGMNEISNSTLGGNAGPEPLLGISLNPSQLIKSAFDHEVSSQSHMAFAPVSSVNVGIGNVSIESNPNRKDDGSKDVTRSCPSSGSKKVIVSSSVISRVIGLGGCNINAIREATGAHIEFQIKIKGSDEATKQAHNLITVLMNKPDLDVKKLLPPLTRGSSVALLSSSVSTPNILTGTTTFTNSNHTMSTTPVEILIHSLKPLSSVISTPTIARNLIGFQVGVIKGSPSPSKNIGGSKVLASSPLLQSSFASIKKSTPVSSGGIISISSPQQSSSSLQERIKCDGGRERNMNERSEGPSTTPQPFPEYSLFDFNNTTGWLQGELAPRASNSGSSSCNSQQSSHDRNFIGSLHSSVISSASGAMNFASVAASGISSNLSIPTAHMTQAVCHNGSNLVGANAAARLSAALETRSGKPNIVDGMDADVPKAEAWRAPGYRGNTTMGSPILRMQQQQQGGPNFQNSTCNIEGPLSSHFGAAAVIASANPRGINPNMMAFNQIQGRPPHNAVMSQNYGHMGAGHNQLVGEGADRPVVSQFGGYQDIQGSILSSQLHHQGVTNQMNYSNNSNNRLNPGGPSFNLSMNMASQQTHSQTQSQQPSTNSSFDYQQTPYSALHQQQHFG